MAHAKGIKKDEVPDVVHQHRQKWNKCVYGNETFETAWNNNIGDRDTVGTAYVDDRDGDTARSASMGRII